MLHRTLRMLCITATITLMACGSPEDNDPARTTPQTSPADTTPAQTTDPEPGDADADGVPDDVDQCPDEPEDLDGVDDSDGCPEDDAVEPDMDADMGGGEPDMAADDGGSCEDRDGDADGVDDCDDACPAEQETRNGFEDDDGCPDDPCVLDDDFDGIGNCDEELLGTDPNNTDTDGDFLSDFEELQAGTNPLSTDTDGDGLDDERELFFGFDPKKKDTLGDGIEDGDRFIVRACEVPESEPVDFYKSAPGDWNIALPAAFSNYTELNINGAATRQAAAVFDDPANEVASFILSEDVPATSALTRLLDHVAELERVGALEQDLTQGLFTTHDRFDAAPGEYVVSVGSRSTRALRDDLMFGMAGFVRADVANLPTSGGNLYAQYVVRIAVIERDDRYVTTVAVAPKQRFDALDSVRFRMSDLTNTTNVAQASAFTTVRCHPFPATTEIPQADFYWVLDQSGSMDADFQNVMMFAQDFYTQLLNTTLDYRFGVTNMESGFRGRLRQTVGWHTDVRTFIDEIQYYVIDCDTNFPGNCSGSIEYGLYAAREGIQYMRSSAAPSSMRMRPSAQLATIFMSDEEPQSYQSGRLPGGPSVGATQLRSDYRAFFANNPLSFAIAGERGSGCGFGGEGYKDVALTSGGASASLCSRDLKATIAEIITIIVGRTSAFRLPRTPISSTLRVYVADEDGVNGKWVPRSRANGFDYFPQTNSIAFFGSFRPKAGAGEALQVAVHYQDFRRREK